MSAWVESGAYPIWIASYPRSGNTFLRIILQKVFHLVSYSLYRVEGHNHRDPSAEALDEAPFLPKNWRQLISNETESKPVLIKTHGPPEDDRPAIYLIRDGRAAIQSYFHYHQQYAYEQPSLTEIIAGACQFGSWTNHYLAWRPSERRRTLLIRYEELVSSPQSIIPVLADFLHIKPSEGHLPSFAELKVRLPQFFRRGKNTDFLNEWTSQQMALFNQLHGPVMQDLGYSLVAAADPENKAAVELASSAARLHQLYEEQLTRLGYTAASEDKLAKEVARLTTQLGETSKQLADKEKFLNRRWVKLGIAVGAMGPSAMFGRH